MAGHSKWAQIKHKKGITDKARGQLFTKLANAITVAAREGGGNPETNFKLRLAIEKAKAANMPKENIERAIKRGTGALEGIKLEEGIYEGFGPGGAAIIIKVLTDNKNRTIAELRNLFATHGGTLAESGAVSYLFTQRGLIKVELPEDTTQAQEEEIELKIIEAGAEDIKEYENILEVYTNPTELEQIKKRLEELNLKIVGAELVLDPKTTLRITDEKQATQILKLMDALEEHPNVTEVYSNFDIPDEIMNKTLK